MKPLGETQHEVLSSLRRHGGYWFSGCGWLWDTTSGTTKIMEGLFRRGLVTKSLLINRKDQYRYDLTEEGKKA